MKIEQLISFLRKHLTKLQANGHSSPSDFDFPDFELTAFDYLDFAEQSLSGSNIAQRINCIAHLKRAAECQLDTFLYIMT